MSLVIGLAESGWIPDMLVRLGIRHLVKQRLREEQALPATTKGLRTQALKDSVIALNTEEANEQHYEVPTEFFQAALGPHLKYSACIYPSDSATLGEAERHTLELYKARLDIRDGDNVLDLGCGWGSFSLWLAQHNAEVNVTAVSNSATQRCYIEERIAALGLTNLKVLTADVNELDLPAECFDKVISVEMFEHVRNYAALMARISCWMKPEGSLFIHIFCHKTLLYPFEVEGASNWMAQNFFTGGLMPAADTLLSFQDDLTFEEQWLHDGTHYERTARHWLENMDAQADAVTPSLEQAYGAAGASIWRQRWRMFFMACEEMFAYENGAQWQVAHYRFSKPAKQS
jgi:cyclopropane-fatty-acyl-phospholipid synthase